MSEGSLLQLVAKGAQDLYLTNNESPASFFSPKKEIFKNFSKTKQELSFKGSFGFGKKCRCEVERLGDLLGICYLRLKLPKLSTNYNNNKHPNNWPKLDNGRSYKVRWTQCPGFASIDNITLKIGETIIDRQYGEFLQIWNDLVDNNEIKRSITGNTRVLTTPQSEIDEIILYVPLKFWFCTDPSKFLPLIALQYHKVVFEVEFRKFNDLHSVVIDNGDGTFEYTDLKVNDHHNNDLKFASMVCTYICLDEQERKEFAQKPHEYLIEQVQIEDDVSVHGDVNISLNFNHPVKELIWLIQRDDVVKYGEVFNYTSKRELDPGPTYHLLKEARILFNNNEHTPWFDYLYYYFVQNYETHSNYAVHLFYMFSFALKPQSQTPTGTANFSRMSNSQLQLRVNTDYINAKNHGKARVYALGYNVLRIQNGLAGLAFSN